MLVTLSQPRAPTIAARCATSSADGPPGRRQWQIKCLLQAAHSFILSTIRWQIGALNGRD
jgi:hypothetical protein